MNAKLNSSVEQAAPKRTTDVEQGERVMFNEMSLSPIVVEGLKHAGFLKPSPIQLKAIPLGRLGL